jgi:hypothetical protein
MGSAAGSEEYVVLRTEQIYRIQAMQTLVGVIIAGFFTSGVVILGWSFGTGDTVRSEVLFWSSPILLAMVLTATTVAVRWHRILYRIGSYLVVFHERPNANGLPQNPELGWLTRLRRPGMQRSAIDHVLHSEAVLGPLLLLFALSCAPIGYAVVVEACNPWHGSYWAALSLSVVEAILTGLAMLLLHRVSNARHEFIRFWESVREQEQRESQSVKYDPSLSSNASE